MIGASAILPNENALVAQAAGDAEALAAIYDHYFPQVFSYLCYRVDDAATADDLTARVFEKAVRGLGSFRPERGPFAAWLFAIARNTCRDHLRAQRRRRWLSLDALRERRDPALQPEQWVEQREEHAQLLQAVGRLSARERDLIALRFAAGLTNRRIAALTGLAENTVGVTLYRALRKLRAALPPREVSDAGE